MRLKLREARKATKLTLAEVAGLIGRDVASVSRWERGEVEVTLATAARLAEIYGCPLADLVALEHPGSAEAELAVAEGAVGRLELKMAELQAAVRDLARRRSVRLRLLPGVQEPAPGAPIV